MLTLAVMRTELVKSLRRPRTYVAYGILVAHPDHHGGGDRRSTRPTRGATGRLLFLASQTGLFLPGFALRVTSAFLLVVIVALFGGDAIAGEASWGNLRYLLMRPVASRPARVREVRRRGVLRLGGRRPRGGHRRSSSESIVFGTDPINVSRSAFFSFSQSTGDILVPPRRRDRVRGVEPHRASSRSRSWCRA